MSPQWYWESGGFFLLFLLDGVLSPLFLCFGSLCLFFSAKGVTWASWDGLILSLFFPFCLITCVFLA